MSEWPTNTSGMNQSFTQATEIRVVAKPEIWSFLNTLSDCSRVTAIPDRTLVFADFLLHPLDGHPPEGFT
jgi:hypothetical protein